MNLIKQYPHISILLLVSIFLSLLGVYAAIVTLVLDPGSERRVITRGAIRTSGGGMTASPTESSEPVYTQVGTALATYKSYEDTTTCQSANILIQMADKNDTSISAYAFFESNGKTIRMPENISLRLFVMSENNSYAVNRTFKIFLEGKSVFRKESSLEFSDKTVDDVVTTSLLQVIPYNLFVRMIFAKEVRFQIGTTSFALTESEIKTFRDLVALAEMKTIKKETKAVTYPVTEEGDVPPVRRAIPPNLHPAN